MDLVTLTDHNTLDGVPGNRRPARRLPERGSHDLFPRGPLQGPPSRLEPHRSPAPRHRQRCARTFSTCKPTSPRENLPHAVAHPLHQLNQKLDAGHVERLILLFRVFRGPQRPARRSAQQTTSAPPRQPDPGENRRARRDARPRADPPGAVEENPYRRQRRQKRHVRRARLHGDARRAARRRSFFDGLRGRARDNPRAAAARRCCSRTASTRRPIAFAEGQIRQRAAREARRPSCWRKCSRGSWRARTRRNSPSRRNWTSSRKASCRAKSSRWPGPPTSRSGANWRGTSRSRPSRPPSPGRPPSVAEPERRAFLIANLFANQLAFRFFTKFVAPALRRQHDGRPAGAQRHRAAGADAQPVHLRVQEPVARPPPARGA